MRRLPWIALGLSSAAWAVPLQINHQGRVFDDLGDPLEGTHSVRFSFYDQAIGGSRIWTETMNVEFADGYYSVVLGTDQVGGPLDVDDFAPGARYLDLAIDGTAIGTRPVLNSVPYAIRAQLAEGVATGADLDVASIRVDGVLVIDEDGQFVGELPVPTLGDLDCDDGQVPLWLDGFGAWGCEDLTEDTTLTDAQVRSIVEGAALALKAGTTINGSLVATMADLVDTTLTEAEVEAFIVDDPIALASGSTIRGAGIANVADLPTEATVEGWITDDALDLAPGTTLDGVALATLADVPSATDFAGSNQACSPGRLVTGVDADGFLVCAAPSGAIQLGDATTCAETSAGTVRFHDDRIEACDGDSWVVIKDLGGLYEFTSHTFTPCGQTGRTGPSIGQCQAAYNTPWEGDGSLFTVAGGIQHWTVPQTGTYRIEAWGAAGGSATLYASFPGRGARIQGDFELQVGDQLRILVGQRGDDAQYGGGGGGGTFVVKNGAPLLVAGGGGGARRDTNAQSSYTDASTSTSGRNSGGNGGANGNGGFQGGGSNFSSGGGGFFTSGGGGASGAEGGQGFLQGGVGGQCASNCPTQSGAGGFGGGGGTYHHDCTAGGGGYSGGGGGSTSSVYDGGGGGSYSAGTSSSSTAGVNTGGGSVIITFLD